MISAQENVDAAEVVKFESMADGWWDRRGVLKSLHDINPLRVAYIRSRITLKDRRVLDVGCGGGILAEPLAMDGARVTGIDLGAAHLAVAKQHMRLTGVSIEYRQISVEEMSRGHGGSFDAVTCMELLEHVPDPAAVIRACHALVRPGGDIVLATLNRNPKSFLFAIIGAEVILRLLPKGTHQYRKFIKPLEIRRWAAKAGLECKDFTGLHYNPFTRRYTLGGNLHVNYLAHLKRPRLPAG